MQPEIFDLRFLIQKSLDVDALIKKDCGYHSKAALSREVARLDEIFGSDAEPHIAARINIIRAAAGA